MMCGHDEFGMRIFVLVVSRIGLARKDGTCKGELPWVCCVAVCDAAETATASTSSSNKTRMSCVDANGRRCAARCLDPTPDPKYIPKLDLSDSRHVKKLLAHTPDCSVHRS